MEGREHDVLEILTLSRFWHIVRMGRKETGPVSGDGRGKQDRMAMFANRTTET